MENIVNYAAGNYSLEVKKVMDEMQEEAKARRAELELLDEQIAEGNVFAERYRDGLIAEREEELIRSAEILRDALKVENPGSSS